MARRMSYEADTGVYQTEHWLAWLFAVIALVMAVIGLLVGFDVIDFRDDLAGGGPAASARDFNEGMLWILPAIAAAVLSMALHQTEHHRSRSSASDAPETDQGLYRAEHWAAYVAALAAIVAGVLCLLVGYDAFGNDNVERDGMLWGLSAIVASVVTMTLHHVRHHQIVAEEDVIVRIIEERTGGMGAPARERMQERPGGTTT